jgi:hypothetical protein
MKTGKNIRRVMLSRETLHCLEGEVIRQARGGNVSLTCPALNCTLYCPTHFKTCHGITTC